MSDRPPRDPRKIHIPAPGGGGGGGGASGPPPRPPVVPGGPVPRSPGALGASSPKPPPRGGPPTSGPSRGPIPTRPTRGRDGRRLPRPKLRRILLLSGLVVPLLVLTAVLGGWLYARSVFNRIDKVEVADVLSHGGAGTNYLIVGSDSRDPGDLVAAGLNPDAFKDGGGDRSDTMLILRFEGGKATMLSIPRDLYVPIAETDGSAKINASYNGGPRRLILTVQQALGIPVHHYLEVDFVSFATLVDSLGGITIEFPYPAFDKNSGLDVQTAGAVELDGPQALAFVRSRHYVEVVDGQPRPDPTSDLGRIARQQQFLVAVLGKLGDSKNPFTLARAAGSASGGLRIDDSLGLIDAARLSLRLRGMHPESVVLPVRVGRNSAGSVVILVQPDADAVLAGFR